MPSVSFGTLLLYPIRYQPLLEVIFLPLLGFKAGLGDSQIKSQQVADVWEAGLG